MRTRLAVVALIAFVAACGSPPTAAVLDLGDGDLAADPQAPPLSATALTAWLTAGHYKQWSCEAAPRAARPNSPHEANRVCSNALSSGNGLGAYPVGAASVKELYATPQSAAPYGHAVMVHAQAGGCDTWFYFEQVNGNVVADGVGVDGCAGCHEGAGTDATHTGHDCVYTQVK